MNEIKMKDLMKLIASKKSSMETEFEGIIRTTTLEHVKYMNGRLRARLMPCRYITRYSEAERYVRANLAGFEGFDTSRYMSVARLSADCLANDAKYVGSIKMRADVVYKNSEKMYITNYERDLLTR